MKNSQLICGLFVVSLSLVHHSLPAATTQTTGAAPLCRPRPALTTLTHMPSGFFSISLAAFQAFQAGEAVEIAWATASETGNDYFTIERSTDGASFTELATVTGAGTSASLLHYAFTDLAPAEGKNYYRLRQTNFDGSSEYLSTLAVDFVDEPGKVILTWAATGLKVSVYMEEAEVTTMVLCSLSGQVLAVYEVALVGGYNEFYLDTQTAQLKGLVIFRAVLSRELVVKKLMP